MIIVAINALPFGSTGNIMMNIAEFARERGHIVYTFSKPIPGKNVPQKWSIYHSYINTVRGVSLYARMSAYSGLDGVFACCSTRKLLKQLDDIKPDLIHLHNLHGWYLNLEMLFSYIKKHNIRVVWTLHDCWGFTGHCPYYSLANCNKWVNGCNNCSQYREYPHTKIDQSKKMWTLKKKWFTGVKDLTVVTPSDWLAGEVKKSFLSCYTIRTIHNGIDISVFKPIPCDFRQRYDISENQVMLLGVAAEWGKRKGLDIFIELSQKLDKYKYQIVLVGTNATVDRVLPDNIISIHSTDNQMELAKIYSAADLFVNPTREEVFGLVNVEALACGTPGITLRSGGSPECYHTSCGTVVDTVDEMFEFISRYERKDEIIQKFCRAYAEKFAVQNMLCEYVDLYEKL